MPTKNRSHYYPSSAAKLDADKLARLNAANPEGATPVAPEAPIHVDGAEDHTFSLVSEDSPVTAATAPTATTNHAPVANDHPGSEPEPVTTPDAAPAEPETPVAPTPPDSPGSKKKGAAKNGSAGRTQASVPGVNMGVKIPVGEDKNLPLKDLTFSDRVQMRTQQFDPATVEKYKLLILDDPDALPPIRVIEITEADRELNKLSTRLIVWDGFQRGEARLAAMNESSAAKKVVYRDIKCSVSQGTFEQSVRLSLQANAAHGLPRSFADMRKAMDRLINDSEMLSKVMAEGVGAGGGTLAIARAIGTSHGFVDKMLREIYKLKVSRDKLIPIPASEQQATPAPEQTPRSDPKGGIRKESLESIKNKADIVIAEELAWYADAMQRRYEVLRGREHAAPLLKEAAMKIGIPFQVGSARAGDLDPKVANPDEIIKVEYWPAVDDLRTALDEFKRNLDSMSTQQNS